MPGTTGTVLVGCDGSPQSVAAAVWAGEEAAARGAEVRLLGVWDEPHGPAHLFASDHGDMRAWEEQRLAETADLLKERRPEVTVTAELVTGRPAHVLLEAAGSSRMLVLGSHQPGGAGGALYGSVSLHAVAHCDRPVVLVRATDTFGERGASQIVLGVDPRRPREELLAFAFEEAAARGLVLRAVRAWEVHQMYGSPMLDPQLDHRLRRDRHDELVGFLAPWCEAHGDVEVVPVVPPGPVALALAEEARADTALLVVGRRRRRSPAGVRVGHVTHGVVHHAPCPVAVVSHD